MRALTFVSLAGTACLLSGCVVSTIVDAATLPVRAGSKVVDLATTSQSEADERRGREIRRREENLARLERNYSRQLRACQDGNRAACDKAQLTYREMQDLMPTVPVVRDSN